MLFSENTLNITGYERLQIGDAKGALEILKLNATAFPESPNVYDSLSDAYLAAGEKELARQNAQKALELCRQIQMIQKRSTTPLRKARNRS